MNQPPTNADVDAALKKAFKTARQPGILLEPEIYSLLSELGLPVVPHKFRLSDELDAPWDDPVRLDGPELFLKVVSPYILHKSDVGGIKVVENRLLSLQRTASELVWEAPLAQAERFWAQPVQTWPRDLREAQSANELLNRIRQAPLGVMICQKARFDSGFGHELLISLNRTREFGPVVTAGLGGVATELLGQALKPGLAVVSAATICPPRT